MNIDKLIRIGECILTVTGFGSLMNIDKLIPYDADGMPYMVLVL